MPATPEKSESGWGAVIGLLVIIGVILFGGVYFFFKQNPQLQLAPDSTTRYAS